MKRIKILLTAAVVTVVIGGAFAFKANSVYNSGDIYTDTNNDGTCDTKDVTKKFDSGSSQTMSGTTTQNTTCTTINFRNVTD